VKIQIKTPARLHLGLIDMNGDLGRLFGGLGLGIDKPNVVLEAQNSEEFSAAGERVDLVRFLAEKFVNTFGKPADARIFVRQAIQDHVGLGSGTQLALAVGVALRTLLKVDASVPELATALGRAQRTGVGTAIFEYGGFVVDGGKNVVTQSFPPLIFRQPFPDEWRFIVAIPDSPKGLSNSEEKNAFQLVSPITAESVGRICRLTMMKLLPALAEHEIGAFGEALSQIQATVGEGFSEVQGGRFSSSACEDTIAFLKKQGAYGTGQSSWGPAVYGLFSEAEAARIEPVVREFMDENVGGEIFIAGPNNTGASIEITR
jgi:beta-ribofuranosylaminobenzene 5'-phosphate synthase